MKILIAPNAFKNSLRADEAAACIARGLRRSRLDAELRIFPVADGGDGTLDAYLANGGERVRATAIDPLFREREVEFAILPDAETAIVEMALVSGYSLLSASERDPTRTTSYGTGQLLKAALACGCRKIVLGVGGSATVDGGIGALQALGLLIHNRAGEQLPILTGGQLSEIASLQWADGSQHWRSIQLTIACDVQNLALGEEGAAAIFAPQKGATPGQVRLLETGLGQWFDIIEAATGNRVRDLPGSGAAGALAGGLAAMLGGRLQSGIEGLLSHNGFAAALLDADLVITGEGFMDEQTLTGKAPLGVARMAHAAGVPTIALVGGSQLDELQAEMAGFQVVIPIIPRAMPTEEALSQAKGLLEAAAHRLGSLLQLRANNSS